MKKKSLICLRNLYNSGFITGSLISAVTKLWDFIYENCMIYVKNKVCNNGYFLVQRKLKYFFWYFTYFWEHLVFVTFDITKLWHLWTSSKKRKEQSKDKHVDFLLWLKMGINVILWRCYALITWPKIRLLRGNDFINYDALLYFVCTWYVKLLKGAWDFKTCLTAIWWPDLFHASLVKRILTL